jgi:hypothetical protein
MQRQTIAPSPAPGCLPSGATLKQRAVALAGQLPDPNDFIRALDKEAGVDTAQLTTPGITIHYSDELMIALFPPYHSYRFAVMEALRKRDPVAAVPVPSGVVVAVSPSQIDSPDIVKLIVERDGRTMAPVSSTIAPTVLTTRLGAKAMLHKGDITYSCAVFAPGATVTATAIPASGSNFVKKFSQAELTLITGRKASGAFANVSADLVGMSEDQVKGAIGEPFSLDGARWTYRIDGKEEPLYVYFTNGKVTSVRPDNYPVQRGKH